MKKIFILIPWFDPAYKAGGPIQSMVNLVNSFNENVSYFIFCDHKDLDGSVLKISQLNKWVSYNNYTKVWYNQSAFPFININKVIKDIQPDSLYMVGLFSLQFNILPLLFSSAPKKILSIRGMLHSGALSQKKFKKKLFLLFLNSINIKKRVHFHATDNLEEKYIQHHFGIKSSVYIAGNYPRKINQIETNFKESGKLKLITIALISPMKNYLLVLQSLLECKGEIDYHIIGAVKDVSYWKDCMDTIKSLPENIKVFIHGEIPPAQIASFLSVVDVMIMPSKSENFGHSLIESLYMGKPVITSDFTPWNELQNYKAGFNVSIYKKEIQQAIEYFVEMTNEEYQLWSAAAVNYAKKSIDLEKNYISYKNMFLS